MPTALLHIAGVLASLILTLHLLQRHLFRRYLHHRHQHDPLLPLDEPLPDP